MWIDEIKNTQKNGCSGEKESGKSLISVDLPLSFSPLPPFLWDLKQGSMSMNEYVTKFTQLSHYAPHEVDTDEKK
jgi:hypothetical protein